MGGMKDYKHRHIGLSSGRRRQFGVPLAGAGPFAQMASYWLYDNVSQYQAGLRGCRRPDPHLPNLGAIRLLRRCLRCELRQGRGLGRALAGIVDRLYCGLYPALTAALRAAPRHPVDRNPRHRVLVFAGIREAVLLVEADGAGVVLVDQQIEAARRQALGFVEQLTHGEIAAAGGLYARLAKLQFEVG